MTTIAPEIIEAIRAEYKPYDRLTGLGGINQLAKKYHFAHLKISQILRGEWEPVKPFIRTGSTYQRKEISARFDEKLLHLIRQNPGINWDVVRKILQADSKLLKNSITYLRKHGDIVTTGEPKKYQYFLAAHVPLEKKSKIVKPKKMVPQTNDDEELMPICRIFKSQSEWYQTRGNHV